MRSISNIFSLFSEKKCYACGQVWHFFCLECQQKMYHYEPYCYVCKKASENFFVHNNCHIWFQLQQVIVFTRYRQNSIKRALKHAKYYGKYKIYEDMLTQKWALIWETLSFLEPGILIPVPMHFFRKWKRGYNQAQKIADSLSQVTGLPVEEKLIVRSRYTKHQSRISQSERLKNLKDCFKVLQNIYPKDTICYLIDDVISTGATLNECAQVLQNEGFQDIRAIVIASD